MHKTHTCISVGLC